MTPNEIARLQDYLRRTFDNSKIFVEPPVKKGATVEVRLADEFIGVLYRDEDEGEVSYSFQMSILEEDLPPLSAVQQQPRKPK